MAHRAAPISVSIALDHASANAVRASAGGWSTGSSACLTSHFSLIFRAPDEKAASTILKSCHYLGVLFLENDGIIGIGFLNKREIFGTN